MHFVVWSAACAGDWNGWAKQAAALLIVLVEPRVIDANALKVVLRALGFEPRKEEASARARHAITCRIDVLRALIHAKHPTRETAHRRLLFCLPWTPVIGAASAAAMCKGIGCVSVWCLGRTRVRASG
eukprot:5981452-Pleurochrysis_carterae.AAC.1